MIHLPVGRTMMCPMTRRDVLRTMGCGFGYLSLASMVGQSLARAADVVGGTRPAWMHTDKPKAKHVIFLFMNGGLSQVDSFDYKPALEKYHGQLMPGGAHASGNLMKSPFPFKKYGQSGIEISEIFPRLGECADDMCVVKSVYTESSNHEAALEMMNTGATFARRPSIGSWITYGLGMLNENLPGFVVLCPEATTTVGSPLWSGAALSGAEHDAPLEAAIGEMERVYRMQTEEPDVLDVRGEPEATLRLYGEGSTARGCLTAARLIERGVRMVQVYSAKGDPWDHHFDIEMHRKTGRDSDQPFAALITDLKSRGLLEETIIVAGSEFGRSPVVEVGSGFMGGQAHKGRDHNPHGFTMWLAGGGFKKGFTYGATDEFGWKAVENPVHVHDIHATILWQLGIDHRKLSYQHGGREYRLTGLQGNVVHELIA